MRVARERCLRLPAVLYAGYWLAGSFLLNVYSTSRCDPESPHPRGRALRNHDLFSSRLRTSTPLGYLYAFLATVMGLRSGTTSLRRSPSARRNRADGGDKIITSAASTTSRVSLLGELHFSTEHNTRNR